MNTQEILDAAYEALNGLSIGWQLANVKDNNKRAELQAPINAGTEALVALINRLESQCPKETEFYSRGPLKSAATLFWCRR